MIMLVLNYPIVLAENFKFIFLVSYPDSFILLGLINRFPVDSK